MKNNKVTYTFEEAINASKEYFAGDDLAANVFVSKYALQDNDGNYLEKTPRDMHIRLAKEFVRIENKYPNPMSEEEIFDLLDNFKYIVPQGSPMSGVGNNFKIQSVSNCFVIESPYDSYGGILSTDQEQVQIMKRRGGVGFDVSRIRPKGMITSNAAKTTDGIEVFLDRFSNSCREVAQGGRRGALMLSISVHHPQIMDFIKIKNDLLRVTGANISVRVTDEFMKAVENKTYYCQQWPIQEHLKNYESPKITQLASAEEIWNELVKAARNTGEPGCLFWDTATSRTPSDIYAAEGFSSTSTNPCGEIILSPYDSCRLMVINLTSFVINKWESSAYFDYKKFTEIAMKAQKLMDDLIDIEVEQIDKILEKIEDDSEPSEVKYIERNLWQKIRNAAVSGRRTGLGITGLGDTLAMLNIKYGSNQSIGSTEKIYKVLAVASYMSSIDLAIERGPFPVWDYEKEKNHEFLSQIIDELPVPYGDKYQKSGRRNIANTTTAPVGSVSCLTKTTGGIEPVFKTHYVRRKKINPNDTAARVDFVDTLGDKWIEFDVAHHGLVDWYETTSNLESHPGLNWSEIVKKSPYYKATANEIDFNAKVRIQAAAQRWVCHAISNTTNLPGDVDEDTVKDLYMSAWKLGCKGITVYRDGSRSGVLVSAEPTDTEESLFVDRHAPKRPESLECDIYHTSIKESKWVVLVGLMDGRPYEVLGGRADKVEIHQKYKSGLVSKRAFKTIPGKYDLTVGEGDDKLVIKDIVNVFDNPNHAGYTRTMSLALRHGVPVQYLVEQIKKDKEADLFSFSKVIARCLKPYIEDGTTASDKVCDVCGAEGSLVYQEGCVSCTACGGSKCG